MAKIFPLNSTGFDPFGELIGLQFSTREDGFSRCSLEITENLLNPHRVVHGAVVYAMSDTGMGAALYSSLEPEQLCATIEIKINYFKAVSAGTLVCDTKVVHRGKRIAAMESEIRSGDDLVAKSLGTYSIFAVSKDKQRSLSQQL